MKIWLPYLHAGSGADVFTGRLASGLIGSGVEVTSAAFPKRWQYSPWRLKSCAPPPGTNAIIANTNIAFAFAGRGIPVVAIEHHCVLDPAYAPYRSAAQAIYHELLVRRFEKASLRTADAVVAVSRYTADSLHAALGGLRAHVILNGIETDFFCPGPEPKPPLEGRPVRLLFVGNLIRRKGADLLPKIMAALGGGFELRYTAGLRSSDPFAGMPGMIPLGRLTREQLRDEYRRADLLLFPTRFEGFGYAAAEAMACGTPVVTTRCSSLPEVVDDGVTGRLCKIDDVADFTRAIKSLSESSETLFSMAQEARAVGTKRFSLREMTRNYQNFLETLAHN